MGAELGEGLGDGGFVADAVDDEVPFLGGEFLGDAEADAARTTSDECYFIHGERELTQRSEAAKVCAGLATLLLCVRMDRVRERQRRVGHKKAQKAQSKAGLG